MYYFGIFFSLVAASVIISSSFRRNVAHCNLKRDRKKQTHTHTQGAANAEGFLLEQRDNQPDKLIN